MDVHIRQRKTNRPTNLQIGFTGKFRMNTTLKTDLRCAPFPGFLCPSDNLSKIQYVSLVAQTLKRGTFRECTESTSISTNIRIVNVAVNHISHGVTDRTAPEIVCEMADFIKL